MPPPEVSSEMSFESNTSIQSSLPEGPRVLLAVSLRADAGVPDVERWANWFSIDVPYEVQGITVRLEAAYRSHSTLILVSLPVNVWNHLRDTSAYRFIGFVTSVNLLTRGPKDWDQYLEAASVEAATVTDISSFIEASSITDPSSISALEESYPYMSRDPTLAIVKSTNQPTPEMLRPLPQSSAQAERHQKSHTSDLSLHIYESCPLKSGDIRILTVRPGVNSDPIECTLTSRSLETQLSPYHETLPYEALSYHWGSGDCSCKIKIKNEDFQTDFKVKPDLLEALLQLRLPRGARRLWIDAICINQDDMEEKNVQVSLMAEIYSGATHVCVWLGKATSDSNLALNLIRRIINPDHFGPFVTDRLVADRSTLLEWAALSSLMKRAWFNRRWVVQEIALAPRATLYCGNDHIDLSDFADAVSLFEAVESESHTISQSIKLSDDVPDILGEIKLLGATRTGSGTPSFARSLDIHSDCL